MSYTPHTWAAGDTVTSARLNALEQGIDEWDDLAPLIVNKQSSTLDKTVGEILEAFLSGSKVIIKIYKDNNTTEYRPITKIILRDNGQDSAPDSRWSAMLHASADFAGYSSTYEDLLNCYTHEEDYN
jgi:hypothetical protein